jgi:O-antigen/teichoic acid export membrane protein
MLKFALRSINRQISKKNFVEYILMILSNAIVSILSFLIIKFTTKMGPSEYGRYALVLSVANMVSLVIYSPLDQSISRYYYDFTNRGFRFIYITLIKKYILKISLILFLLLIIFSFFLGKILELSYLFLLISGFFVIISTSQSTFFSILNVIKLRTTVSILQVAEKAFILTGIVLLFLLFTIGATSLICILSICYLLFIIVRISILNKFNVKDVKYEKQHKILLTRIFNKKILLFALPIVITGFFSWAQTNSERWLIEHNMTTADVGLFAFIYTLSSTLLLLVVTPSSQFVNPLIFENFSDKNNLNNIKLGLNQIKNFTLFIICVSLIIGVLLYTFSSYIILFFSNSKFLIQGSGIIFLIYCSVGFFNIGQTLCLVGFVFEKYLYYLLPKGITALLLIFAVYYGSSNFGLKGVAVASCCVNFLYIFQIILTNRLILRSHKNMLIMKNY